MGCLHQNGSLSANGEYSVPFIQPSYLLLSFSSMSENMNESSLGSLLSVFFVYSNKILLIGISYGRWAGWVT